MEKTQAYNPEIDLPCIGEICNSGFIESMVQSFDKMLLFLHSPYSLESVRQKVELLSLSRKLPKSVMIYKCLAECNNSAYSNKLVHTVPSIVIYAYGDKLKTFEGFTEENIISDYLKENVLNKAN